MRFISFTAEGRPTYGIVRDKGVVDLGARFGGILPDLTTWLEAEEAGLSVPVPTSAPADYRLDEIIYDPVIPFPNKIICVGLNYEEHRIETKRAESAYPSLFTRFADTLIGHNAPMIRPRISGDLDYEAELAIVIGKEAFRVPRDRALEVIAGYSCFNEGSIRDFQRHTHQFMPGKNFPGTGAFGPELVTLDEISGFDDLRIETRLNGTVMQSAVLGQMIFNVPHIIEYVTSFTPLGPGDVIATGTPGGVGARREPPVWMKSGDVVEVTIESIGHLVNEIRDETEVA
jgi:2-keto-4-pentenoate hydratase/2-oxohepta-3-ene-1,7-dioic acid hydratase in catechol pathway